RNKRLGATLTCRLNCDVHCFKLKLSTEYATAHYPIFDLKYVVIVGCGAKDNRANETVVANSIQKAELKGQSGGQSGKICYLFGRVASCCRVELVGFVDQLDNPAVVDGREWSEYYAHFKPAQEIIHTLCRPKQGLTFGIGGILPGATAIFGREGDGFEVTR